MERKLATIRRIKALYPIDGKDRIVLAEVDGWQVIVQKDEYKEGDLCIYCEIDSVLPKLPPFEFLAKRDYRIKTLKMGGVLSQGICFPLSVMDDLNIYPKAGWQEGDDVTEVIGVTKWERPDAEPTLRNRVKKPKTLKQRIIEFFRCGPKKDVSFPSFIAKTDEVRIQNASKLLTLDERWIVTEKVDGTSATFAVRKKKLMFGYKYEYYVCSRNRRLPVDDDSAYWQMFNKYKLDKVLVEMMEESTEGCEWLALQGEIIGPGIQGNKYKLAEPDVYFFNYVTNYGRLNSIYGQLRAGMHGLKWVPIMQPAGIVLPDNVEDVVYMSAGESKITQGVKREGIVCRSTEHDLSFKCVDPNFLIKYDE